MACSLSLSQNLDRILNHINVEEYVDQHKESLPMLLELLRAASNNPHWTCEHKPLIQSLIHRVTELSTQNQTDLPETLKTTKLFRKRMTRGETFFPVDFVILDPSDKSKSLEISRLVLMRHGNIFAKSCSESDERKEKTLDTFLGEDCCDYEIFKKLYNFLVDKNPSPLTSLDSRQSLLLLKQCDHLNIKTPKCLLPQLLDILESKTRDAAWVKAHKIDTMLLTRHISDLTCKQTMSDDDRPYTVVSHFLLSIPNGHAYFPEDVTVRHAEQPEKYFKMSRMLVMKPENVFAMFFKMGNDTVKDFSLNELINASCCDFKVFKQLYLMLSDKNPEHLDHLDKDQSWLAIAQCDYLGIEIPDILQRKICTFIPSTFEALEAINGAIQFGMRLVQAHCLSFMNKSDVFFLKLQNNESSAFLYKDSETGLNYLDRTSDIITRMSVDSSLLDGGLGEMLPACHQLSALILNVRQQDISQTAKQVLSECNGLRSLTIKSQSGIAPKMEKERSSPRANSNEPVSLDHITQLDLRTFVESKSFKRVSLGLIRMLTGLRDLRLAGNKCVTDDFLLSVSSLSPLLEMLDIGYCRNVTDKGLETSLVLFKALKLLNLAGFRINNKILVKILKSLPLIIHLNLRGNSHLAPGFFKNNAKIFNNYQFLDLTAVQGISETDWITLLNNTPLLKTLKVSGCPTFKFAFLLDAKLNKLEELVISVETLGDLDEDDLRKLKAASPRLERIFVEGKATEAQLAALARAELTIGPMGLLAQLAPETVYNPTVSAAARASN